MYTNVLRHKQLDWESKGLCVGSRCVKRMAGTEFRAWPTRSACSFIFNLRSIEDHCRTLIRGVGYPDVFYLVPLAAVGEWTVVG